MLSLTMAALALGLGAGPTPTDLERHARAARELEALFPPATEPRDLPRMTDPRIARLLSTLSDEGRFLASPFPLEDLARRMEICSRAARVMVQYMLAGAGSLAAVDPEAAARRMQTQMARNTRTYQDELSQLMPFVTRCQGRATAALAGRLQAQRAALTDVQRQGLAQMRLGVLQLYTGVLVAAQDPGLKNAFRERLLAAAADAAPALAAALTPEGRRSVLQTVRSLPVDAAMKVHAAKIEQEMSRTDCTGMCAL